ncbi:DRAP deaminase [Maublancomyces gigas]|uniref:DRAP deaminase n=1 Tax=Discina gigas TaxID=1032678 RepID=A0ABR3GVX5_9PEZI
METSIILAPKHLENMHLALLEAQKCVATPTAYCVGAILTTCSGEILSTGYSRELPGNTHAEQCCLEKLAAQGTELPEDAVLYTTMEPCSKRLSGNSPCVDRIIATGGKIKTVYVGVREPDRFVKDNVGLKKLMEAGVEYICVTGLEEEILKEAIRGHGSEDM